MRRRYTHEQGATFANRGPLPKATVYLTRDARDVTGKGWMGGKGGMTARDHGDSVLRDIAMVCEWHVLSCTGLYTYHNVYRGLAFYRFFPTSNYGGLKVLFSQFRI